MSDLVTNARLAAFRNAIAHELKDTPLGDVRVSTRNDTILGTTAVRAAASITVHSTAELDDIELGLAGDEIVIAYAHKMGRGMRREWDKATGIADLVAENAKLRDVIARARREADEPNGSHPRVRAILAESGIEEVER